MVAHKRETVRERVMVRERVTVRERVMARERLRVHDRVMAQERATARERVCCFPAIQPLTPVYCNLSVWPWKESRVAPQRETCLTLRAHRINHQSPPVCSVRQGLFLSHSLQPLTQPRSLLRGSHRERQLMRSVVQRQARRPLRPLQGCRWKR